MMKIGFWVALFLFLVETSQASCWSLRDPADVAREAPVVLTGKIVRIDIAAPGRRVFDVAHIKISGLHKNLLSDVSLAAGGEIKARMVGEKCQAKISTDLRYPVGTEALWLIFLQQDGTFSIFKRPEQRLPVATLEKFYLQGVLRDRQARCTKAEWIARAEKPAPDTKQVAVEKSDVELRLIVKREFTALIDESKPLKERLARVSDQPFEVRRPIINEMIALRGRQKTQKQLLLFFLNRDKATNIRASSASGLGVVKPMDQETVDALTKAILKEERMVRVMAAQTIAFCQPADATDMRRVLEALLQGLKTDDATERFSVARSSAHALGFRKHEAARDPIVALLEKHPTNVKVAVTCGEALAKIGGATEHVLKAVDVALTSKNWNIRHAAARSLEALPPRQAVSFVVYHLADEMRVTVENIHSSSVGDRSLQDLVRLLENQTDQKLGTDVNAWIKWYKQNADQYAQWSNKPLRGVAPQLMEDYRWAVKAPRWERCLRLLRTQRGNYTINSADFFNTLRYLDRTLDEAPKREFLRVAATAEILDDLWKHRDKWKLDDPYRGRIIYPGDLSAAQELEFWLQRVRRRIEQRRTKP